MSALARYFLSPYDSESFMIQQQSRILFYFIGVASVLVTLVTVIMNIKSPEAITTGRNLMRISLISMCVVALILLRMGRYRTAANMAVFGCVIIMGLQLIASTFSNTAEMTSRLFLLYIFTIIAAVFTKRWTVITCSALNMTVAVAVILRSDLPSSETFLILFYFSLTLIFITILSFLLLTIVSATIRKIEDNRKKEEQHVLLKKLLAAGRDLSQDLAELSERLTEENQSLSQRTARQSAALQEITATIEEAAAAINENSESTGNARDLSIGATGVAEEGVELAGSAAQAIAAIREAGDQISGIIAMMNEISFQTNLLALNAAVEAAHAGDMGRGFAVVANEVRNLAKRSADFAKEIGQLIKQSNAKIGHGTELIAGSGEVIARILKSIQEVSELITGIAERSNEQKKGIEQINKALEKIDADTQENVVMVDKTSAISEDLAEKARELLNTLQRADSAGH